MLENSLILKTYPKSVLFKIVLYCHNVRNVDQAIKLKVKRINFWFYIHFLFDKGANEYK